MARDEGRPLLEIEGTVVGKQRVATVVVDDGKLGDTSPGSWWCWEEQVVVAVDGRGSLVEACSKVQHYSGAVVVGAHQTVNLEVMLRRS